ncbi:MAG TPA: hypothetical protein VEU47_11140 [Candidatus Cybelea sp.]|nr:hypothetical protein [Candidatus Cybelea sp.]
MSKFCGVVKQIAVTTDDRAVVIELICTDAYAAQVLSDDIVSRLKCDHVLSLIVKVGALVDGDAK